MKEETKQIDSLNELHTTQDLLRHTQYKHDIQHKGNL